MALWSKDYTNFQGSISARGGSLGGNGGRVETSSGNVLDAFGSVSTFAAMGRSGEWLLDPSDVTIQTGGSGSLTGGVFDPATSTGSISPGAILSGLSSGDVTIQTHAGSGGNGDITLAASINTTGNLGRTSTLTLKADRDITVNAGQTIDATTGGNSSPLNVVLWSNYGNANAGGAIVMNPGSKISSNGGDITLGGGTNLTTGYAQGRDNAGDYSNGIALFGAQRNSAGGNITLRGTGAAAAGTWQNGAEGALGVLLGVSDDTHDTIINSGTGTISITGFGTLASNGLNAGVGIVAGDFTGNAAQVLLESSRAFESSTTYAINISGSAQPSTLSTDSAGVVWEGMLVAAKFGLSNLTVIVDYNGVQQTGSTAKVMPTEPIADKWASFNWHVTEIHGHNMADILDALDLTDEVHGRPSVIIARTTKGKGVSFMENACEWHGAVPTSDQFRLAEDELRDGGRRWRI